MRRRRRRRSACVECAAIRGVAQPGSALAWGARGREFESRRPDQSFESRRASFRASPFFSGGRSVRILVSNDDGYLAPGLQALARIASRYGEVTVVAPEQNHSGASNSLTLARPLTVARADNG